MATPGLALEEVALTRLIVLVHLRLLIVLTLPRIFRVLLVVVIRRVYEVRRRVIAVVTKIIIKLIG